MTTSSLRLERRAIKTWKHWHDDTTEQVSRGSFMLSNQSPVTLSRVSRIPHFSPSSRSASSLIGYTSLSEERQIRTCPAVDSHEKVQTYQHCGGKTLTAMCGATAEALQWK
ncbi:uncharacterized [Tachysurus ichikawai]